MEMTEDELIELILWVLRRCPVTEADASVAVKIAAAIAQQEAYHGKSA